MPSKVRFPVREFTGTNAELEEFVLTLSKQGLNVVTMAIITANATEDGGHHYVILTENIYG